MTATTERPGEARPSDTSKRGTWLLIAAVVVLGIAVIVLAVLLINDGTSESAAPAEVEAVVDDYIDAAIAQDSEAWLETITDDWFQTRYFFAPGSQQLVDVFDWESEPPEEYVRALNTSDRAWNYEEIADPLIYGDGPWYVTISQFYTPQPNEKYPVDIEEFGNMTYVVVERDGAYLVAAEVFTGTIDMP